MWQKIIFIVLIVLGIFSWMNKRAIDRPPGVLAPEAPYQEKLTEAAVINYGDYRIKPLAAFQLKARVLSATHYTFDGGAKLCPVDLALGWGPMSDSAVLKNLSISQNDRYYFWSSKGSTMPIPREEVEHNSANMHMIPANGDVKKTIQKARKGNIIALNGYLVKVDRADGWHWSSSLSRNDTGGGACELVWVERASLQ